jgi:solute carrier family 25 citrate transporter 1
MIDDRTKLIDDQKREVPRYRGLLHGTLSIVNEEGIGGIYRGLFPVVRLRFVREKTRRVR